MQDRMIFDEDTCSCHWPDLLFSVVESMVVGGGSIVPSGARVIGVLVRASVGYFKLWRSYNL